MRIFVTGASGFIGSEFCRQARAAGHQVFPLVRPYRLDNLPRAEIISFAPESVVHCAWIATPGVYTDSPENFVLRRQSVELFDWLTQGGVRHFLSCGTCAEYAPSEVPLDEDLSLLGPVTPYAQAKHGLHMDLKEKASQHSIALSWARIFYPYGPGEHPDRLISSLMRGYKTGRRVELRAPEAVLDYIHVYDVVSALLTLVQKEAEGSFNIGTGHGVSLGFLEAMVASLFPSAAPSRSSDPASTNDHNDQVVASIEKMRSLGWCPHHDLRDGLSTYIR